MIAETVYTVSLLNEYVNTLLKNDVRLRSIKVSGEISGFKIPSSGHLYFSLKDENALIRCVMFRSYAQSLSFLPENGMKVVLTGSVSMYVRDGQYQFYATGMKKAAEGELYREFLELKEKLDKEGLFSRKRPIPKLPGCVGIATSITGAAVHDMLTVIKRRFPMMDIIIADASVQGANAPKALIEALSLLNETGKPDVIIIGRGGGSYEDLSCFNDEGLARAIYASRIPVVSAVGHETDFTIADFAADMRAPTPSAAAETVVPVYDEIAEHIAMLRAALDKNVINALDSAEKRLSAQKNTSALADPGRLFEMKRQHLNFIGQTLNRAAGEAAASAYAALDNVKRSLEAMNPQNVLKRGYAIVRSKEGSYIKSVSDTFTGQELNITVADGAFAAEVTGGAGINDKKKNEAE